VKNKTTEILAKFGMKLASHRCDYRIANIVSSGFPVSLLISAASGRIKGIIRLCFKLKLTPI
jgi:hypothetical protein